MHKTRSIAAPDVYLELVKQFPLRRLKSEPDYAQAIKIYTRTSLKYQDTKNSAVLDYLEMLAGMIEEYEQTARQKLDALSRSPADLIRHLIAANGLTISALARETGIVQSNLSDMLSGRRDFSKNAIARLCNRFALNANVFF